MVAAWIGAAYWFTASTSFANQAITVARSLSDTFASIRPVDAPVFIAAQLAGALLAAGFCSPYLRKRCPTIKATTSPSPQPVGVRTIDLAASGDTPTIIEF